MNTARIPWPVSANYMGYFSGKDKNEWMVHDYRKNTADPLGEWLRK